MTATLSTAWVDRPIGLKSDGSPRAFLNIVVWIKEMRWQQWLIVHWMHLINLLLVSVSFYVTQSSRSLSIGVALSL